MLNKIFYKNFTSVSDVEVEEDFYSPWKYSLGNLFIYNKVLLRCIFFNFSIANV